jgi:AbrB family looped-hinge helix DNA binding protein
MLTTRINENGRIVIPVEVRRDLQLETGDELLIAVQDGRLLLQPRRKALQQARATLRQQLKLKPRESLVDELLTERRQEIRREAKGTKRRP